MWVARAPSFRGSGASSRRARPSRSAPRIRRYSPRAEPRSPRCRRTGGRPAVGRPHRHAAPRARNDQDRRRDVLREDVRDRPCPKPRAVGRDALTGQEGVADRHAIRADQGRGGKRLRDLLEGPCSSPDLSSSIATRVVRRVLEVHREQSYRDERGTQCVGPPTCSRQPVSLDLRLELPQLTLEPVLQLVKGPDHVRSRVAWATRTSPSRPMNARFRAVVDALHLERDSCR